jgi:hypothetical protein
MSCTGHLLTNRDNGLEKGHCEETGLVFFFILFQRFSDTMPLFSSLIIFNTLSSLAHTIISYFRSSVTIRGASSCNLLAS